jgi:hypothetical protein
MRCGRNLGDFVVWGLSFPKDLLGQGLGNVQLHAERAAIPGAIPAAGAWDLAWLQPHSAGGGGCRIAVWLELLCRRRSLPAWQRRHLLCSSKNNIHLSLELVSRSASIRTLYTVAPQHNPPQPTMSPSPISPLMRVWYRWKAFRLPWRRQFLIGTTPTLFSFSHPPSSTTTTPPPPQNPH